MEQISEIRTMSPANKTRITGFSASIIMLIFFTLAEIFHHELIFWSLAMLSFVFSGFCHIIANLLSKKSGNTGAIDQTIHYMNNKMIMLIIYSVFIPLKLVHWTFVLIIMFPEFTMIMMKLLGLLRGESFQQNNEEKRFGRIKRISQVFAATVFSLALFNYNEKIHFDFFSQITSPYMLNPIWQQLHIALQVIIASFSIITMVKLVKPYKESLVKALKNAPHDKNGKLIKNKDKGIVPVAYYKVSRANWATLWGLGLAFIMDIFFLMAEFTDEKKYRYFLIAFVIFAMSMILDGIDGWLARKDETCGELGGTLDQIRDKKTMLMIYLPLLAFGSILVIFFIILMLREFLVSMFRIIYLHEISSNPNAPKLGVSAKFWGKVKTFSQSIAALVLGANLLYYSQAIHWPLLNKLGINYYLNSENWRIGNITLQIILIVVIVISGIMYAIDYKYYLDHAFWNVKEQEKSARSGA